MTRCFFSLPIVFALIATMSIAIGQTSGGGPTPVCVDEHDDGPCFPPAGWGCVPVGKWIKGTPSTSTMPFAGYRTYKTYWDGTGWVPRSWAWGNDSGWGFDIRAKAIGKWLKSEVWAYIWAEDGDSVTRSWVSDIQRLHTFKTVCMPLPNHVYPPKGAADHQVTVAGRMYFTVGANAGGHNRSASASLLCVLPTGAQVKVNYTAADAAARSYDVTINGSASTTIVNQNGGSVSGDHSGEVQAEINTSHQATHSGSVSVNINSKWKENDAASDTENIYVTDCKLYTLECHGLSKSGDEIASSVGNFNITARCGIFGCAPKYIDGYFLARTRVLHEAVPTMGCGLNPPMPPMPPTGGSGNPTGPTPGTHTVP